MSFKVSVVLPVYNVEKYLRECVDSILSQTLKDIEIIFVDDGSTDNSYNILMEYNDPRIKVFHQINSGPGPARNLGLEKASGEFVNFIDPDDCYASNDVLEVLYNTAIIENVSVVGGNLINVDFGGEILSYDNKFNDFIVDFFEFQDFTFHQKYLIRRSLLIDNKIKYPSYRRFEDPPFLARVLYQARYFYGISKYVYKYRYCDSLIQRFDFPKAYDHMRGIIDLLKFGNDHNLKKIQDSVIIGFAGKYLYYMYKNLLSSNCTEGLMILEEFNKLIDHKSYNVDYSIEGIKKIHSDSIEYSKILSKMAGGNDIVIYGAGVIGNRLKRYFDSIGKEILGFAVSKLSGKQEENVHELKYYKENYPNAMYIISVTDDKQPAMVQNLKENEIDNYYCLDSQKFNYYSSYYFSEVVDKKK